MQVPPAKYDVISGLNFSRPRSFVLKIIPKKKDPNEFKIKKSKDPDIGSYNVFYSYKKTQLHGYEQKGFISKTPKTNFLDLAIRARKAVPAPGKYDLDKCYNRLSTSPMSSRIKRH